MITVSFHKGEASDFPSQALELITQIGQILRKDDCRTSLDIRKHFVDHLHLHGWSGPVRVDPRTNIRITSLRHNTGLSIQTGNVGRCYADLLKFDALFKAQRIRNAIYIVPTKRQAIALGNNVASFERVVRELPVFSATITVPIAIFGIEEG